jgi:hypothetical protein
MRKSTVCGALALACVLALGPAALAGTTTTTSPSQFEADTTGLVIGDLSSVTPLSNTDGSMCCFAGFSPLSGYSSLQGVSFSTPNAGGAVNVDSAGFYGSGDLTLPYIVPSTYTGSGPDVLVITLPQAETAFGLAFNTLFSLTNVTFTLSNGFTTTVASTTEYGDLQVLGFLSTTPFTTITMSTPNGTAFELPAFAYGSAVVPEPASWAMMLGGLFGLGALLRRGRRTPLPA